MIDPHDGSEEEIPPEQFEQMLDAEFEQLAREMFEQLLPDQTKSA